jgi:hypothetical protein
MWPFQKRRPPVCVSLDYIEAQKKQIELLEDRIKNLEIKFQLKASGLRKIKEDFLQPIQKDRLRVLGQKLRWARMTPEQRAYQKKRMEEGKKAYFDLRREEKANNGSFNRPIPANPGEDHPKP